MDNGTFITKVLRLLDLIDIMWKDDSTHDAVEAEANNIRQFLRENRRIA